MATEYANAVLEIPLSGGRGQYFVDFTDSMTVMKLTLDRSDTGVRSMALEQSRQS